MPEDSPDVKLTTNRSGWVWAGLVAAAGALAALDCFARGYASLGMTALAWTALIVWLVLLFLVFPGLWLTPSGLRVRNPLTVIEIPFGALRDLAATSPTLDTLYPLLITAVIVPICMACQEVAPRVGLGFLFAAPAWLRDSVESARTRLVEARPTRALEQARGITA